MCFDYDCLDIDLILYNAAASRLRNITRGACGVLNIKDVLKAVRRRLKD